MQFSKNEKTVWSKLLKDGIPPIFKSLALVILWGLCSILIPLDFSYAQDGGKGRKRTAINFEDELVEGQVQKPELMYLLQKKQFNFKRLIKLRQNFLPEMRRTAEDIQPVGSEN